MDSSLKWALDTTCTLPIDDGLALALSICDGVAIVISDGSFKSCYGTTAYFIRSALQDCLWLGMLPCLGMFDNHDAYQSKLSGLLALVTAVQIPSQDTERWNYYWAWQ